MEGLEQGYVVCPSEKRFLLLFTFLKKNRKKKVCVTIEKKCILIILKLIRIIAKSINLRSINLIMYYKHNIQYTYCLLIFFLNVIFLLWQVMVFFSSCMSVKFHNELLNYIGNLYSIYIK